MSFGKSEAAKQETAREMVQAARLCAAVLVVSSLLLGAAAYQAHTFDKRYHAEWELATQSASPGEMVRHLEHAQDGLNEVGYDTGQYAWFLKTPETDTDRKRAILQSHLDRAKAIEAMEGSEREVAFMEYRNRLTDEDVDSGPDIDTYGWWWRSLPYGVGVVFSTLFLTFVFFAWLASAALGFMALRDIGDDDYAEYRHLAAGTPDWGGDADDEGDEDDLDDRWGGL